jgi:hypothetical protein
LINCEKGSLSIFAGRRYNYAGADFETTNNNDPRFLALRERLGIPTSLRLSGSESFVDPVVGIGGKIKVAKAVSLYAKADVGGFTVASDCAFEIGGGVDFNSAVGSLPMSAGVISRTITPALASPTRLHRTVPSFRRASLFDRVCDQNASENADAADFIGLRSHIRPGWFL